MYTNYCYIIETKSNLHVGTSTIEETAVDNVVQRDANTKLPTINDTSLKGALKEFIFYKATHEAHANDKDSGAKMIRTVFGSDADGSDDTETSVQKGQIGFDSAKLLSLPVATLQDYYYRATSECVLKEFLKHLRESDILYSGAEKIKELLEKLGDSFTPIIFQEGRTIELDVYETEAFYPANIDEDLLKEVNTLLEELIGERVVLLPHNIFSVIAENLPVEPRNVLENGISQNLWYEEYVPRESKFYFILDEPEKKITFKDEVNDCFEKFNALLTAKKTDIVKLGNSKSVGHGRCFVYALEGVKHAS